MEAGVPTLAVWLRRQVEARLELARHAGGSRWETGCTCAGACHGFSPCDEVTGDDIHIYPEGGHDSDQAAHIAANDPADTIARCEAELGILDLYEATAAVLKPPQAISPGRAAREVRARDYLDAERELCVLGPVVRLLGGGYRGRPGYREAI